MYIVGYMADLFLLGIYMVSFWEFVVYTMAGVSFLLIKINRKL